MNPKTKTWLERKVAEKNPTLNLKDVARLFRELNQCLRQLDGIDPKGVEREGLSAEVGRIRKRIDAVRGNLKAHRAVLKWARERERKRKAAR